MPRVIVVSKVRLYREGIRDLLERDGRVEVVATTAGPETSLEMIAREKPDVVLLDSGMPHAVEVARSLAFRSRPVHVLALGLNERRKNVLDFAEAGVSGYVSNDSSLEELVRTIERTLQDEVMCSPRIAAALFTRLAQLSTRATREEPYLTPREQEVAALLDEGLTNQEIGSRLHITVSTVKIHVHNILDKLGVRHRGQAAAKLRRLSATRTP